MLDCRFYPFPFPSFRPVEHRQGQFRVFHLVKLRLREVANLSHSYSKCYSCRAAAQARPRNRTSVSQPDPRRWTKRETPQGRTEAWPLGTMATARHRDPAVGHSARCYARIFPDHAERELAQGDESPWRTTPTEQCGWLATGTPDYQLRRKVATPPPGFEPGTQRLTVVCATAALRGNNGRRWGAAYASPLLFHFIKPFGPTCERCRASCDSETRIRT